MWYYREARPTKHKRRQVGGKSTVDTENMEKEKNISPEESLDLYAEFARLCGAPADMDRDGQIALFQQYQQDFDEMKEELFKDTTYEEQEELANTFIVDWIADTRAKKADRKGKPTAPPEAYAAFVYIYKEWVLQDVDEQNALVEQSVDNAFRRHMIYKRSKDYSQFLFRKGFTTMYGEYFGDYVNEVWADFLERFIDAGKFVEYLQQNCDRNISKEDHIQHCQLLFDRMVDNYIKRAEKEWNETIDKRLGKKKDKDKEAEEKLPKELLEDLDADCERRCAELLKIKRRFEETTAQGYPSLQLLLRRSAQNVMARLYEKQKNASQVISLDADTIEASLVLEIEDKTEHGRIVEDELGTLDCIEHAKKRLDERNKKILDDKMLEFTQTEIAEKLGLTDAAVSKRVQKIKNVVQSII